MIAEDLCPAQRTAYDWVLRTLDAGSVAVLTGRTGSGKTAILQALHSALGGALLTVRDFAAAIRPDHPFKMEEAFERTLRDAVAAHDVVLVDDLDLVTGITGGCGYSYPRAGVLDALLASLLLELRGSGKRMVFASDTELPDALQYRAAPVWVPEFAPDDYEAIARAGLPEGILSRLDFGRIFRFAPRLNGYQIAAAGRWLRDADGLTTDEYIEFLRSHHMASNVDLGEVQTVDLADLKGIDDLIEALETDIIIPLENDELASTYGVKPKRGVLLAGPPGTGKTTVGRALAHRLRSKFFLIDGTIISGTEHFYEGVHRVFQAAKANAPSIIFIDDSDVIFESGNESGLYRYLLTMLDGLESQSAGRVCVMMTAMDVGNLPPALVRSGRIELWLETRLPDTKARGEILRQLTEGLAAPLCRLNADRAAEATEGLTGADLKRLVEDAKLLFARDRVRGLPERGMTELLLEATDAIRAQKERYALAEAHARRRHPERPIYYDVEEAGAE